MIGMGRGQPYSGGWLGQCYRNVHSVHIAYFNNGVYVLYSAVCSDNISDRS